MDSGAGGIGIDCDALSGGSCVRERVRIVMVHQPVNSHATRGGGWTGLRRAAALQVTTLRWII